MKQAQQSPATSSNYHSFSFICDPQSPATDHILSEFRYNTYQKASANPVKTASSVPQSVFAASSTPTLQLPLHSHCQMALILRLAHVHRRQQLHRVPLQLAQRLRRIPHRALHHRRRRYTQCPLHPPRRGTPRWLDALPPKRGGVRAFKFPSSETPSEVGTPIGGTIAAGIGEGTAGVDRTGCTCAEELIW